MRIFWNDLTYGWRKLARNPGFAAVAVLTIALGIGANTVIFSVVNAVLMQPLPYKDPDRLVLVWNRMEESTFKKAPVAAPDVVDYRQQTRLFEGFAATNNVREITLTGDGNPAQIKVASITANFFTILGIEPFLGRNFTTEDEQPIPPAVSQTPGATIPSSAMVVSYGFWQRRFGGDPEVVGQRVQLDGRPMTIVGVLPRHFELLMPPDAGMPTDIDAFSPLRMDLSARARDQQFLRVIARLLPGVTLAQAQAEMDAVASRQREEFAFHKNMGISITVKPMHGDVVGHVRPALLALLGAVGLVLAIACANIANLLLARAKARSREMTIRTALGASRQRITRQVLTEGFLLSLLGGVAGLLLAQAALRLLMVLQPADLPRLGTIALDGTVLLFTLGTTVLAAMAFGMAPALESAAVEAGETLGARGGVGSRRSRLRGALVVAEVALSLVLLIGAGLLLRSFIALAAAPPGFEPRGALTYKLSLPFSTYGPREDRTRFFRQMEDQVAALPGVDAVGAIYPMPLGGRFWTGPYGRREEAVDTWSAKEADFRAITPGYFQAMGTPLMAGRSFVADDLVNAKQVAIIDTVMAARLWPGESPIGQEIGVDLFGNHLFLQVVGVAAPIRHENLTAEGRETLYLPHHLFPWMPMTVIARTATAPTSLLGPVKETLAALDEGVPVYAARPLDAYVDEALAGARFMLVLIAVFAAAALLLAAVGLYGVIAYAVRQRRREIGLRMALGARGGDIFRQVVARGLLLTLVGLSLGLVVAVALSHTLSGLLYGVPPADPLTFGAVAALVLVVAFLACFLPARRAARIDPMRSLRAEVGS